MRSGVCRRHTSSIMVEKLFNYFGLLYCGLLWMLECVFLRAFGFFSAAAAAFGVHV